MTAPVVERRPAHHSAFLLGKAQTGVETARRSLAAIVATARTIDDALAAVGDVVEQLAELRVQLGDVHASDVAGVDRGRRSERRDDMQALIEAVRS